MNRDICPTEVGPRSVPALARLAVVSLLQLAGCVAQVGSPDGNEEPVGIQQEPLYTASGDWLFSSIEIPVCFVNDPNGSSPTKDSSVNDQARTYIEESFGRVTSLMFHGWGWCPSGCNPYGNTADPNMSNCPTGIVLRLDASNIGKTWNFSASDGRKYSRVGERAGSLQVVLLHEFAHALGFDHELDRPDLTTGGCQLYKDKLKPFTTLFSTKSDTQNYYAGQLAVRADPGTIIRVGCALSDEKNPATVTSYTGDTFLRLIDPTGKEVACNDDYGSACSGPGYTTQPGDHGDCSANGLGSYILYTVPSNGPTGFYTVRQGCYQDSACSGTTVYTMNKALGNLVAGQNWTPPDLSSVLVSTYCGSWTTLSPWDVVGLQRAYGRKLPGEIVGYKNKCLAIDYENSTGDPPSKQAVAWDCYGDSRQTWNFASPAGDTHIKVRDTPTTNGTLDVQWGNTANGTPVWNWTSNTSSAQVWNFLGDQIRGMGDLCLDFRAAAPMVNSPVKLGTCSQDNTATSQQWDIIPINALGSTTGKFVVVAAHQNTLMVLTAGTHAAGELSLQNPTYAANQIFKLVDGDQLQNMGDGQCMDVAGAVPQDGTTVQTWPCRSGGDSLRIAQQWTIRGPIKNRSLCLDADTNTGNHTGTKVQIWSCNGQPQQTWESHW